MGVLDDVWESFGQLTVDEIPARAQRAGAHSLLDWFGVATAGTREPLARILCDELLTASNGSSTVFGAKRTASAQVAALINGATGHALDYDDTNLVGWFHQSVPIAPAALAVAEAERRSGADLLAAYVVGVEIASRIGAAIGPDHYARGWHTTSSIGVFGAAAASAWLLGLDRTAWGMAMGLASSQSSGVQANFATMTKPFHAGHAAERGVLSARLAARGYTASLDALQATAGLFQAASTGPADQHRMTAANADWAITQTMFKYHAACHGTHSAIEAALEIAGQAATDEISHVEVLVHPGNARVCRVDYPRTGLEAKFSLRATVALALLGDNTADPASFNDRRVLDSDLRELMNRIDVLEDTEVPRIGAVVRASTAQTRIVAQKDIGDSREDLDEQEQRLRGKFHALAAPVLGEARTTALADRVLGIASVRSLDALRC